MKLNLGCGPVQPPGWVNVDGSHRAWLVSRWHFVDRCLVRCGLLPPTDFQRGVCYANLSKPFPWPDNSVEAIYQGEILEHFTRADGLTLLCQCWRVLRPGGVLRIRVPDNARFWANYLDEYERVKRLPRSEWNLTHTRWIEKFFGDIYVRRRWLASMGHYHKWMYDEVSLIKTLEETGFRDPQRRDYHDSRIADVASVEVRDDLIVEAVKP